MGSFEQGLLDRAQGKGHIVIAQARIAQRLVQLTWRQVDDIRAAPASTGVENGPNGLLEQWKGRGLGHASCDAVLIEGEVDTHPPTALGLLQLGLEKLVCHFGCAPMPGVVASSSLRRVAKADW